MAVASAGHVQVCTSLQTDNHTSTSPLKFFTGRMPFLPPNQQRQSTEGTALKAPTYTKFIKRLGELSHADLSGLLNRVPASAGIRVGMSLLPGGR